MAHYRITGKQDGMDYGRFQADSELEAIETMLDEAGVEDPKVDHFTAQKVFLLTDIAVHG